MMWQSKVTGELVDSRLQIVKVVLENLFRFHFLDLTWERFYD